MILELENIGKSFGEKRVLDGISFSVKSGEAFGLLGRNGAGKTTTLRILNDIFSQDSGRILLDGKPIDRKSVRIGYLPEERGLYPRKVVEDQLLYFAMLRGLSRREGAQRIDYWLKRLQMTNYRRARLDTLSKGNQQKIQLITALVHDPHIVFLDEPFSGLDPVNAMLLKDVVRELIANGKLVLFSGHYMSYIEEFCDGIAILNSGKIVLSGNLAEIKRGYARDRLVIRTTDSEKVLRAYGDACRVWEKDSLLLQLPDAGDKQRVMQELVSSYNVDEVRVYEPSLNDIFVAYAEKNV